MAWFRRVAWFWDCNPAQEDYRVPDDFEVLEVSTGLGQEFHSLEDGSLTAR